MMLLLLCLIVLSAGVAVALYADKDTGHVMISLYGNTVETNAMVALVAVLLVFVVFYFLVRMLSVPKRYFRWRRHSRLAKSRRSLERGLVQLAEGHWEKAERLLTKGAKHSDTPMIHHLVAARAAQELGATSRRDYYLRLANENNKDAELAVGLTQANLQREQGQLELAHTTLEHLHTRKPRHSLVLKQLMDAYIARGDWNLVLHMLPEAAKRGAISIPRAEELERSAYHGLLEQAAERQDAHELRRVWEKMPRDHSRNQEMVADYARLLANVDHEAGDEVAAELAYSINRRWNPSLVYLYGALVAPNVDNQLEIAQRWLEDHKEEPALLLTLGRLCVRKQLWGLARSYLEASLRLLPHAETFRELGALLEKLNEKSAALECYRQALAMVPGTAGLPKPDEPRLASAPAMTAPAAHLITARGSQPSTQHQLT